MLNECNAHMRFIPLFVRYHSGFQLVLWLFAVILALHASNTKNNSRNSLDNLDSMCVFLANTGNLAFFNDRYTQEGVYLQFSRNYSQSMIGGTAGSYPRQHCP